MAAPTTVFARLRDDELPEGFAVFDLVVVDEVPELDSSRDGELCAAIARCTDTRPGYCWPATTGRTVWYFPARGASNWPMHALSKLLEKLRIGAVPHGFCSSLRDWAPSGRNTRAR